MAQFYVTRSTARHRNIIAAFSEEQHAHMETVAADDPDLIAYMSRSVLAQKCAALDLTIDDIVSISRLAATAPRVFVDRDSDGMILAEYATAQRDGQESTHPNAQTGRAIRRSICAARATASGRQSSIFSGPLTAEVILRARPVGVATPRAAATPEPAATRHGFIRGRSSARQ